VLRRLIGSVARVAESDATVLIEGRPGTGKSAVAEMIHRTGRRMAHPMVELAADTATVESLEQHLHDADHGILLIEDVEQLAPAVQSRLVRYLKEERGHKPAGIGPDARIVATTSTRLPEAVARGRFREDLYYRLNVFPVQVPSLQERRDDIALLATHFLTESAAAGGTPHAGFSATAMILLETHPWPGNVAQLRSVIQRAHLLAAGAPIDRVHLMGPATGLEVQPTPEVLPTTSPADDDRVREADILPLEIEERRLLARALKATAGNVRRAAELLKIGRATLYRKIQVYDLKLR
jgi:two-component system response regulator FlrC